MLLHSAVRFEMHSNIYSDNQMRAQPKAGLQSVPSDALAARCAITLLQNMQHLSLCRLRCKVHESAAVYAQK
jgi:hypothetical protein